MKKVDLHYTLLLLKLRNNIVRLERIVNLHYTLLLLKLGYSDLLNSNNVLFTLHSATIKTLKA